MRKTGPGAGILLGTYNALYRAACSGVYPAVRAGLLGRNWRWEERMGRYAPLGGRAGGDRVWVHAASVGEVKAAGVLIQAMLDRAPGTGVVVSAVTPAGLETARSSLAGVESVVQAPVDLGGPVRRALAWADPSALVIVETEIWPNMILECHRKGTPVGIASAKVSGKSYRVYRYIRPLMRHILSRVTCAGAQSELDRDRLVALGLPAENVEVTGDIKLDASREAGERPSPAWLERALVPGSFLFVAGSTRPGEEEIVGKALLHIDPRKHGRLTAIIAPRHVDRSGAVAKRLERMGLSVVLRSRSGAGRRDPGPGHRVVVLDTMGELQSIYPRCDAAFVGGTLAPYGGHNAAEPATAGVGVLFGPSTESIRAVTERLIERGGGVMVTGAGDLSDEIAALMSDPGESRRRGEAASGALRSLRGACARTLELFSRHGLVPGPRKSAT